MRIWGDPSQKAHKFNSIINLNFHLLKNISINSINTQFGTTMYWTCWKPQFLRTFNLILELAGSFVPTIDVQTRVKTPEIKEYVRWVESVSNTEQFLRCKISIWKPRTKIDCVSVRPTYASHRGIGKQERGSIKPDSVCLIFDVERFLSHR